MYIELPVIANSSDNVALINCINMFKNVFLQNSLMLNMNKTQLLNISRTSSVFPSVIIDSITIVPCNNVKNFSFICDDNLNLSDQIANVCKSTNYQLHKIRSIRKFLPFRISKMLIESLVVSRINYCCSLYYCFPTTSTNSLDRIIISSIRVLRVKLHDHESVNYLLVNSKWLYIYQRSTFSYLNLIFKILKNRLLSYLNDLLQFRVYKRSTKIFYSAITKEEVQAIKIW